MSGSNIVCTEKALEQVGGDMEFLIELFEDLVDEIKTQREKILNELNPSGEVMNSNSLVTIQRAAHVIKGSAANLACTELTQVAAALENAAKGKSPIVEQVRYFNNACENLIDFLARSKLMN